MTYTGCQQIRLTGSSVKLSSDLEFIADTATEYGLKVTFPEVDKARVLSGKATELRALAGAAAGGVPAKMTTAGKDYAAGKMSAEQLVTRASNLAALTGGAKSTVAGLIETAAAALDKQGIDLLRSIGDRWLDLLRPTVTDLLDQAAHEADIIGIDKPRPRVPGVLVNSHPWAPTQPALASLTLRHAWERLGDVLDRLDTLHSFGDYLRCTAMLPAIAGPHIADVYRWARLDRLNGDPSQVREFYLANRVVGEPGIYCAADVDAAKVEQVMTDQVKAEQARIEQASAASRV